MGILNFIKERAAGAYEYVKDRLTDAYQHVNKRAAGVQQYLKMRANSTRKYSLRRRWLRNGSITLLLIMLVVLLVYSIAVSSYHRNGLRSHLETKAETASEFFSNFSYRSGNEFYDTVYLYTESYEDADGNAELQFISAYGSVIVSNNASPTGIRPNTPDISKALSSAQLGYYKGKEPASGKPIMSVSGPLLDTNGEVVGALRYVADMQPINRQITYSVLTVTFFAAVVVVLVLLSNIFFIHTITGPIETLTDAAKRIADGSYGVQVGKNYDDEIGVLTDTINEMSTALAGSEKLQSEFISSVSHELRTPLTAITGWSETLMYDEAIQGDSRRGIQIISSEASRLTKMVVELLEFTRIQDGRFNLSVAEMDLSAELEDVIFTYNNLLQQDELDLQYTPCEEEIPLISGDANRLRQVFLNVLDNAIKYGRNGKCIEVATALESDCVKITFRDYGPGIPENELPFVKQKFYKGSGKERGSGIGLAVCEEIVERHKGTLSVENAPDCGVLVTVSLPLRAS